MLPPMRGLASLLLVLMFGTAGYVVYGQFTERQAIIAAQARELREKERVIARLTASSRVAQAMVTKRWKDDDGVVWSQVRFVELGPDGKPLYTKNVVVKGETVYFDARVLKFDQGLIGEGDGMKGKSLVLFRRLFGEHQNPADGEPLDEGQADGVPRAYRTAEQVSDVEVAMWKEFWTYARDPEAAKAAGVRVAQGEAPYLPMEENTIYDLTVDHAGGLNIKASPVPAVMIDEDG